MSWLDSYFTNNNYTTVQADGVTQPPEPAMNFTGSGVTVTDDPSNGRTTVTISGGGGGSTPTGTGIPHIVGGVQNAAASLIVNADVNAAAAIAGTKVSPDFGSQNVTTTGNLGGDDATLTGDLACVGGTFSGSVGAVNGTYSGYLTAGSSPASTGNIRLGGGGGAVTQLSWYNGSANRVLLATENGGNGLVLGNTSDNMNLYGGSLTIYASAGSIFQYAAGVERLRVTSDGPVLGGGGGDFGGGTKLTAVANCTTPPGSTPTGYGLLYSDAGAGKWKGTSGTVTTFGPADPHCPRCGRDFAIEHRNDDHGEHISLCVPCLIGALTEAGVAPEKYLITHEVAA